jgi:uncharacterized membrane protein YphA (DoxX/SURF4 family)
MIVSSGSKVWSIGLWALKIVVGLAFIAFASFKLTGAPMMVREFDQIGLGQGFRYLTGLLEVAGAVLLIVPSTTRFGSPTLLAVSVGALITQAAILHGDVVHTIVLIVITGFLSWLAWRPGVAAVIAAE